MNYVVMGVSGCGKSTVGAAFAAAIGGQFVDGDDLHPPENVAKMSAGVPLTDADRWPWLDRVGAALTGNVVIGCSALKRAYRDRIRAVAGPVRFLHLAGSRGVIAARMAARPGHFMPLGLLDSQFAALEPLAPDEDGVAVDIDQSLDAIVAELLAHD
jgi:gluconokinase